MHRSAHPRYGKVLASLTTATHDDTVIVLSSAFIIAQSDTNNREYLISFLQKISLEQLLLSKVFFLIL